MTSIQNIVSKVCSLTGFCACFHQGQLLPVIHSNNLKTDPSNQPPRIPAVIFCDAAASGLKIAALTLLDRLVVAVHRAGVDSIAIVTRRETPALKRAAALGIAVRIVSESPALDSPALLVYGNVLVQAVDIRALLRQGGRLTSADGTPLPIGILPTGDPPDEAALDRLPECSATGVALRVSDSAGARQAEAALWTSLTSSSDGLVDKVFNRPCGRYFSKLLIHTAISPNAVSLTSIGIGLVAAWFFAMGSHQAMLLAAILFQFSAIVDCVDGDIARVLFKESPFGKWLDLAGDQVVHVAVFAAIAIGLARTGESPWTLWLGISAVLGAVLSFVVVVRGMRQPANDRNRLLQKLIDAATNRDFSVLVLALAFFNRLEWFLWMSAIGSHLFWMTAFMMQFGSRTREHRAQ
ncbi:MAG: CDP-alcohol phosphatidyltransferase family protein [Pedosphaera sp.]|nr:CDP-alcohol phosphatidyltransferase family protein [Pedosphaera sp.]